MHCYLIKWVTKIIVTLTCASACNNTIHNILLRFLRMFLKFAEQVQLRNMRVVFNLSSIQTGCLSAFSASFANVFKIRCFDLALVSATR